MTFSILRLTASSLEVGLSVDTI